MTSQKALEHQKRLLATYLSGMWASTQFRFFLNYSASWRSDAAARSFHPISWRRYLFESGGNIFWLVGSGLTKIHQRQPTGLNYSIGLADFHDQCIRCVPRTVVRRVDEEVGVALVRQLETIRPIIGFGSNCHVTSWFVQWNLIWMKMSMKSLSGALIKSKEGKQQ